MSNQPTMKRLVAAGLSIAAVCGCGVEANDPSPLPTLPTLPAVRFEPQADDFFRLPWPSDGRLTELGTVNLADFPRADDAMLSLYIQHYENWLLYDAGDLPRNRGSTRRAGPN